MREKYVKRITTTFHIFDNVISVVDTKTQVIRNLVTTLESFENRLSV